MYTILLDGRTLFDPTSNTHSLEAPVLSREANKLASLEFTIYPNNPEYNNIRDHTSKLSIYRDGTLMIEMRPVYRKNTFAGGVAYRCEELAAKMDDVLHRPDYYDHSIRTYINHMVSLYNDMVGEDEQVHVGDISFRPTRIQPFINDDYEGFWEGMINNVVGVYGGYLIPRYTNNGIYIDYKSDEQLPVSTQTIRFGENMASMFLETESDETYSVLIPLGAEEDLENPHEDQASSRPMTIASVNDGKDYLENQAAINLYGRREKTQQWQSISDAAELKAKGEEYLAEHAAKLKSTITLTVIDLHNLNVDVSALEWMTQIPIYSEIHNVDVSYTASKMVTNLGNPEPLQLQMGEPKEVFTDRVPQNSISRRRSGGGGGGGRGGGGAASQEELEHWEMIVRKANEILKGSGIKEIYESGVIIDAESGVKLYNLKDILIGDTQVIGLTGMININAENIETVVTKTGINSLGQGETLIGKINVEAGRITQIVSAVGDNGQVTAASIVLAINTKTGSSVHISADKIYLDGQTTIDNLLTGRTAISSLRATAASIGDLAILPGGSLTLDTNELVVARNSVKWKSFTRTTYNLSAEANFMTNAGTTVKGKLVTGTNAATTIYYLGHD